MRTAFGTGDPAGFQRWLLPLVRPFLRSPAKGTATSIRVASGSDLERVSGRYVANCEPKKASTRS